MKRVVILDTGPLGMVTHPGGNEQVNSCKEWLLELLSAGTPVVIPEIADYELRRELLRAAMHRAAELWAEIRRQGKPTADSAALDGDVILAAQALTMGLSPEEVVVATTNPGHLTRLVQAEEWASLR